MRIEDLECRRCGGVYQNVDRVMSVMYGYAMFSICPKCSEEVASLMGFTTENITKELANIKLAETENNRLIRIDEGYLCAKCEVGFEEDEPRIATSQAGNTKKYHLTCYEK